MAASPEETKNWRALLFKCCSNPLMCLCIIGVPCGIPCLQCIAARNVSSEDSGFLQCACATFGLCLGTAFNRASLRKRLLIEGSFLQDCLCHMYCYCCSLSQEWREAMLHKHNDETRTICNYNKDIPSTKA